VLHCVPQTRDTSTVRTTLTMDLRYVHTVTDQFDADGKTRLSRLAGVGGLN